MAMHAHTLPDDPDALKDIIVRLQGKLDFFEEQLRLSRVKQFAASTEASPGQGELFNEAEAAIDTAATQTLDEPCEEIRYTRKKPTRKPLPVDLPREEIVHDIPDDEKVCACCQGQLHKMGEERSEQLEYIPATLKVIEHVRPKYSCRTCEKEQTHMHIVIAPMPTSPIPKSIATPSLLSQIITHKYQYALPLYRQETLFKQYGIDLSRKTLSNWVIKCADLLKPLIDRLKEQLKEQPVIHADETTVKVINDDKHISYMWLYCSGTDGPGDSASHNIVLYDYQPTRAGRCAADYLSGYTGYLQVDGYAGYEQTEATLVGCLAHARRKFVEAEKAQQKGKTGKANWAINQLQKLYRIEKQLAGKDSDERYRLRQEKAKPILDDFKVWLDKSVQQVVPKSLIGKAIQYSVNQWDKLVRYLDDERLSIDNNRAERAIKPFVIGRKNWMFSNTSNGANASAVLYSLIETAKANGIEPVKYLTHLLAELPKRKSDDGLDDLLPWAVNV